MRKRGSHIKYVVDADDAALWPLRFFFFSRYISFFVSLPIKSKLARLVSSFFHYFSDKKMFLPAEETKIINTHICISIY